MKENREVTDTNVEDIEEALEKLSTGKKIKLYGLLRTFKREGIENFVTTRKKHVDVILSDYKRVLKENELLRKDIEGWEKYCEEIREEQTEMSNKNYELEFKVEKLQKENEKYKRLSEMNLKNAEEFKNNMCEHRCLLKSENEELQRENEELKKFITEGITVAPHSAYKNYRLDFLRENFVSKKKIKNKIEELSKTKDDLATHIAVSERIRALQEILEESEDSKDGEG